MTFTKKDPAWLTGGGRALALPLSRARRRELATAAGELGSVRVVRVSRSPAGCEPDQGRVPVGAAVDTGAGTGGMPTRNEAMPGPVTSTVTSTLPGSLAQHARTWRSPGAISSWPAGSKGRTEALARVQRLPDRVAAPRAT